MQFILIAAIGLGAAACNGPSESDKEKTTKIVFEFHDSSVPPPYHRSYKITADKTSAHIVVDSYGDIINDKTFEITEEDFDEVVQSFYDTEIKSCVQPDTDECDGGTGYSIYRYDGDKEVFKGYVYRCAGQYSGDMCGDFDAFGTTVKSLIPDLSSLLE